MSIAKSAWMIFARTMAFQRRRLGFLILDERNEKVYVAFGLTVAILRQKSLAHIQFIRSNEFQVLVAWVNAFNLNRNEVQPSSSIECPSQKPAPEIIPPSKENLVQGNGNNESLPPTPPITPSPPNSKSTCAAILHVPPKPEKKLKRTLSPNSGLMRIFFLPLKNKKSVKLL